MTLPDRRNSPKMVVIRAVDAARFFLPVLLFWQSFGERLTDAAGVLPALLFWGYTLSRVRYVLLDWWTTRYRLTPDTIEVTEGLLSRTRTVVEWRNVVSVQASRPWLHQALGCSLVGIGLGTQGRRLLTLEAVPDEVAAQIQARRREVGEGPDRQDDPVPPGDAPATATAPAPEQAQGPALYTIRPFDYLVVSITYGQFALFVPAALAVVSELSKWVPLPGAAGLSSELASPTSVLVALTATTAVGLAYGVGVAWLRYRHFTVRERDGTFVITGGLASRESRLVPRSRLSGLKVEQNPLMRVTGRARLSVLTTDPGARTRSNVLLPAVREPELREVVATHLPRHATLLGQRDQGRRGPAWCVAGLNVSVLAAGTVAARLLSPESLLLPVGLLAALQLLVTHRCWASVRIDAAARLCRYRRGLLWVRQYQFPLDAVHTATHRQGPVRRLLGAADLSLVVYDGRRVRLRVPFCRPAAAERVMASLVADPGADPATQVAAAAPVSPAPPRPGSPPPERYRASPRGRRPASAVCAAGDAPGPAQ